jgi:hypothetical protein
LHDYEFAAALAVLAEQLDYDLILTLLWRAEAHIPGTARAYHYATITPALIPSKLHVRIYHVIFPPSL